MKLIKKPKNRTHEEAPGYTTVYGKDERSIGVMVSTLAPDYFWYVGNDKDLAAEDATTDTLDKLAEVYGVPAVVPYRADTPKLETYEPVSRKLQRAKSEELFLASIVEVSDEQLGSVAEVSLVSTTRKP